MCRVLAYLGEPLLLDDVLYKPDNSFVKQTLAPRMLPLLNLAGYGMAAWDDGLGDPTEPLIYKDPSLPQFDSNLRFLAGKIQPRTLLGHIRGVPHGDDVIINRQNVHPFAHRGTPLVMAHNGGLARFRDMRYDLVPHIAPEFAAQIHGTTDSEWVYSMVLSQLKEPKQPSLDDVMQAVTRTFRLLREIRDQRGIDLASALNLFLTDGRFLVATRFVLNFGCYDEALHPDEVIYHSLWYTHGQRYGAHDGEFKTIGEVNNTTSVIVSSEPLTADVSTWVEVPEYSMVAVEPQPSGQHRIRIFAVDE